MRGKSGSIFVILIIVVSLLFPIISFADEKIIDITKDTEIDANINNFYNVNDYENNEEEDIEKYSDAYKEYLKLSDEEKAKYGAIPEKYNISIDQYYATKEMNNKNNGTIINTVKNLRATSIPESFDLRNKISIRVENQGSYQNCWTFATTGTLKTYLALNGYKASDGKTIDFSELHLDYLTSNLYSDKGYGRKVHEGGNFSTSEQYFGLNDGPVYESTLPYSSYIQENTTELNRLDNMQPAFYVHKTVRFPNMRKVSENGVTKIYNSYGNEVSSEEMTNIRNEIKQHIMTNGGLYCSIRTNDYFSGSGLGAPYNTMNGKYSQYDDGTIPTSECGSHAVTIIGWDDNYSRMNFNSKNNKGAIVHPNKNGAYIAMNSWGSNWGENGYFYISYEDNEAERYLSGYLSVDKTPQIVQYSFKNENAYNAFKRMLITKKIEMKTDDNKLTIETIDFALSSVSSMDLSDSELTDEDIEEIFKIEYPNLTNVNLRKNQITKITPLLKNKNIQTLTLSSNIKNRF